MRLSADVRDPHQHFAVTATGRSLRGRFKWSEVNQLLEVREPARSPDGAVKINAPGRESSGDQG